MDTDKTPKTLTDLENNATSLRDSFATDIKSSDIHLDALHINPEETTSADPKVDFSGSESVQVKEDEQLHYWRWFLRLVTITRIGLILGVITFAIYQYSTISLQPNDQSPALQTRVRNAHDSYKVFLGYFGGAQEYRQWTQTSFVASDPTDQLDNILYASLSVIDRKYIIQSALSQLIQLYIQREHVLADTQRDIGQYGFLPQELVSIFQSSDVQVSLQRGLVALESIKFSTAIQVFSYLDTFITEFAGHSGREPSYIREQMQYIIDSGDEYIHAFLSHCYMNPYELSSDCSVIGDFDVWYANRVDSRVDLSFLKQLLYYIDEKLEQTDTPSFTITFQRFDPRAETITFSIEVNTFQQDEAALIQAGIINPHIHIVTSVIHLLQQNRFIQGSAIDARQINIQPKMVRIGSNQFVVNNSVLQYTLPLQQDVAREIYDF